ncbi:MAG: class I SAM-dependent methyltransferase [Planctomycetales bacterium]|nr:class I SAM-dependent methyltransferase [Planctomycetales bacterium]
MMTSAKPRDYVLQGGDRGAERLRLLAAVKWPTTKTLLERVGLRSGRHCLDVGCGAGAVTLQMAEAVKPTGRVTGLDFDERCVGLARLQAQQRGLDVEFRIGSASDLSEDSAYDLVFSRFLLTHLLEPKPTLERMVQAAKRGGVVVVEDIQFTGHFCYPACAGFDRYVELYQEVVRRKGGDPNIGPRLLEMFLDAGLAEIEVEVIQPSYRHGPGKEIASITMEHIREAVVGAGLASDEEINDIVADLDSFASNPRTLMSLPRIFQVWGKRPD